MSMTVYSKPFNTSSVSTKEDVLSIRTTSLCFGFRKTIFVISVRQSHFQRDTTSHFQVDRILFSYCSRVFLQRDDSFHPHFSKRHNGAPTRNLQHRPFPL